jgi:sugar phosphate isomerase/epimerase
MASIPIALQLYSVREDCANDFPATLEAVAKMGYDGVEFAGYHGLDATELKSRLGDLGLKVAGTHTGIDTLLGDELEKTVEFNKTIGNKFLIVPGLPDEYRSSLDQWRKTADIFNEISAKLKPLGMKTGYHNHHIEFEQIDGTTPWDVFFGNTIADVVMQLDTGNALVGAADPVPFLDRYPGRADTVHVKEHSATNDKALIGEGDVDWARMFELVDAQAATEWYIVEQESYAHPPLECVDVCLKNLKNMLA